VRNPKRIPRILKKLQTLWEKVPDMRLGQLLVNVERGEGFGSDLFNVEDNVWEKKIDGVIAHGFGDESKRVNALLKDCGCSQEETERVHQIHEAALSFEFTDDSQKCNRALNLAALNRFKKEKDASSGYQELFTVLTERDEEVVECASADCHNPKWGATLCRECTRRLEDTMIYDD